VTVIGNVPPAGLGDAAPPDEECVVLLPQAATAEPDTVRLPAKATAIIRRFKL